MILRSIEVIRGRTRVLRTPRAAAENVQLRRPVGINPPTAAAPGLGGFISNSLLSVLVSASRSASVGTTAARSDIVAAVALSEKILRPTVACKKAMALGGAIPGIGSVSRANWVAFDLFETGMASLPALLPPFFKRGARVGAYQSS